MKDTTRMPSSTSTGSSSCSLMYSLILSSVMVRDVTAK